MNGNLRRSTKTALRELMPKERAVEGMRMLYDSGAAELFDSLKRIEAEVKATRGAFESLSEEQKDVLTQFYVCRGDGVVGKLCRKYCCSQSTVYRMHREALKAMTISLFGRFE